MKWLPSPNSCLMQSPTGCVELVLSDGKRLSGKIHSSFTVEGARVLVGRSLDLKSAYKQQAINPSSYNVSVTAVFDPESASCKLFIQRALPFGSSASVLAFNRISRAIWRIGVVHLSLLWTSYFDDFPQVTLQADATSSWQASELLCKILGWSISEDPKKRLPFQKEFVTLGVVFDFQDSQAGKFCVKNKESRAVEFHQQVQVILSKGTLSAAEASSLRGRFSYADAQVFGRIGRFAMAPISERAHASGSFQLVTQDIERALLWLDNWLCTAAPRVILRRAGIKPVLIFTDGAVEGTSHQFVTCGALAFFPDTNSHECFGFEVHPELLFEWAGGTGKQVVGQAELLPVLSARLRWQERIKDKDVIWLVANSALDALIKGYSDAEGSLDILRHVAEHEMICSTNSWYGRVPSFSNIADGPSRLSLVQALLLANSTVVEAQVTRSLK